LFVRGFTSTTRLLNWSVISKFPGVLNGPPDTADEAALEADVPEEVVAELDGVFEPPTPKPSVATAAMTKMTTTAAMMIRIGLFFEAAGSAFMASLDRRNRPYYYRRSISRQHI